VSIRETILTVVLALGGVAVLADSAAAADVYVNGVKIGAGALRGTVFENVGVRFDAKGDVYIVAPGYRVEVEPLRADAVRPEFAQPPSKPVPPLGRRYWLVVNTPRPGIYKVLITANGAPVADLDPNRRQYVVDLTSKLHQGENRVELTYLPIPGAVSEGGDVSDVMVGLGAAAADGTLTISRVLAAHKQPGGRRSAEAVDLSFTLK
jgi:hypothetical protein